MTATTDSEPAQRDLFHRLAVLCGQGLLIVAAGAATVLVVHELRFVVVVLLVAMAQIAVFRPVVSWCARHGVPRGVAAAVSVLLTWAAVTLLVVVAVHQLIRDIEGARAAARSGAAALGRRLGDLPDPMRERLLALVAAHEDTWIERGLGVLGAAATQTTSLVAALVMAAVLAVFVLATRPKHWASLLARLPAQRREATERASDAALKVFRVWLTSSAVCALFDAVAIGGGMALLGLPFAVTVAILTFLVAFLPMVGALLAGVAAISVALVFGGVTQAVLVLALVVVVQQVEGMVLSPLMLARGVHLHPAVTLILMLMGSALLGGLGMVIIVPVVSALVIGASAYRQTSRPILGAVVATRSDPEEGVRPVRLVSPAAPELTLCDQWDTGWVDRLLQRRERSAWRLERAEARVTAIRDRMTKDEPPMDAGGMPALLVPGMGCPQSMLGPMAAWLRWLGFEPTIVAPGHGMGCGEQSVAAVLQALKEITDDGRRKAVVLAHSRGGQFARVAAVRAPHMVAGLITLGSPTAGVFGVRPRLALPLVGLGVVGSIGGRSVVGVGCLVGGCCRDVRRDLAAMLQPEVRFLSVFSRRDGVVSWRSCLDPSARLREVTVATARWCTNRRHGCRGGRAGHPCSMAKRTPPVVVGLAHRS